MHAYMRMCACIVCMHVRMYVRTYVCTYARTCVHVYIEWQTFSCGGVRNQIYVCMYVCIYIYVYI